MPARVKAAAPAAPQPPLLCSLLRGARSTPASLTERCPVEEGKVKLDHLNLGGIGHGQLATAGVGASAPLPAKLAIIACSALGRGGVGTDVPAEREALVALLDATCAQMASLLLSAQLAPAQGQHHNHAI